MHCPNPSVIILIAIKYLCCSCVLSQGIIPPTPSEISSFSPSAELQLQGRKGSQPILNSYYSLKKYCPIPGDQGKIDICTGFAFAYGAMTILSSVQRRDTNLKSIIENTFSPYFLYQISKGISKTCFALSPKAIENTLRNYGCVYTKQFNINYTCDIKIDSNVIKAAESNKIRSFNLLYARSLSSDDQLISNLQSHLSKKSPVILYNQFDFPTLRNLNKLNYIYKPPVESNDLKDHAVTLIGYDDKDSTFEILNSWGTKWGNDGYFKVKYYDLPRICNYAFELSINNPNEFIGHINFTKSVPKLQTNYSEPRPIRLNIKKTSVEHVFSISDNNPTFDPVITYFSPGTYVYVFIFSKGLQPIIITNENNLSKNNLDIAGYGNEYEFYKGDKILFIFSRKMLILKNTSNAEVLLKQIKDSYFKSEINKENIDNTIEGQTDLILTKKLNRSQNDLMHCLIKII